METQIIPDSNGAIKDWVCAGLNENTDWCGENYTCGFVRDGKLIGGLIYHDYRLDTDVWWTIFSTDKRWCTKRVLHYIFSIAFGALQCRRISLIVSAHNQTCLNFVRKLGFKEEGRLRAYRDDGSDGIIFGMLKSECRYL